MYIAISTAVLSAFGRYFWQKEGQQFQHITKHLIKFD